MFETYVIEAGTKLFHGTSSDFDLDDELIAPAWFSTSESVARNFVGDDGGKKRILVYEVSEDIHLPCLRSRKEMEVFCKTNRINRFSAEEIADGMSARRLAGWIIPDNYPDGDDILLVGLASLKRLEDMDLEPEPPRMRAW